MPRPLPPERLHALLLNGGARRESHYFSHLDHLRRLLALLSEAGVDPTRIAVLSGDGADPGEDLATREPEVPPDFWLLSESLQAALRPPIVYVDSQIDGTALRPATRAAIEGWFADEGRALGAGDTLLLYVTDHGESRGNPPVQTISLWGEKLAVAELRDLLATLDPAVRVVLVMSQCYSGGFADVALAADGELPTGRVCGYFSTTADRKAHGCYPEVSRSKSVGHSNRLLSALEAGHPLRSAQRETLVTDDAPDVPLATSGLFLERRLALAAAEAGRPLADLADELIAAAREDPLAAEPEIRLLDRMGQAFGFASPRSLAALETQARELEGLSKQLGTYAKLWGEALEAVRQETLRAFQNAEPDWTLRLQPAALRALDAAGRRLESDELVGALVRFSEGDRERNERLEDLHWKAEEAKAARYRSEVRLGVVLRMRAVLLELAGRGLLESLATDEERAAYAALEACEDLALSAGPAPETPAAARSFPTLAEERRTLERVLPGWLGIRYRPPDAAERRAHPLPPGAAVVTDVLPDGPAEEAGLAVGDILLGPPDEPFAERHAVREWTMRGTIGGSRPLLVLQDGEEREVEIRLAAYPLELPSLPAPPELGAVAPPLDLELLPGAPPPPAGPRLLFFWATWCGYCKKALPELAALGRERGLPVVAISDESAETLERFAREHPGELPAHLASDRRRTLFRRYGVSGTPTFVLVDGEGVVRDVRVGYDPRKGLGLEAVLGAAPPREVPTPPIQ